MKVISSFCTTFTDKKISYPLICRILLLSYRPTRKCLLKTYHIIGTILDTGEREKNIMLGIKIFTAEISKLKFTMECNKSM